MKWKKFTLTTTTEAVDLISYTLDELGIEGIEIEDNIPLTEKETKGMFIDILPELPPDEGVASSWRMQSCVVSCMPVPNAVPGSI